MKVTIEYDKDVYAPGDVVTANISMKVAKSIIKIKAVNITVNGFARVSFMDTDEMQCSSYHNYISRTSTLWIHKTAEKSSELALGTHTFTYRFPLPLDCDSSFKVENDNGVSARIRYDCTVRLVRRGVGMNRTFSKKFKVVRDSDFYRSFRIPSPVSGTLESRYFPFQKGSITAKVVVDKSWYIPGEIIYLDASINNQSPRTISSIQLILLEEYTCSAYKWNEFSRKPTKKSEKLYQRCRNKQLLTFDQKLHVISGSEYAYAREIRIPQFVPRINKCKFIEVRYYLQVRITCSIFGTSLTLNVPLVIGMDNLRSGKPSIPSKGPIQDEKVFCSSIEDSDEDDEDDRVPLLR